MEGMLESTLPDITTLIEDKSLSRIEELTTSNHSPTKNKAIKVCIESCLLCFNREMVYLWKI